MIKAIIFDVFETLITHYTTPLYFGAEMAKDIGIRTEEFQLYWKSTFEQRTIGEITFEEILETILKAYGKYSEELFHSVLKKRVDTKIHCMEDIDSRILPMLEEIKKQNLKLGIISNCFSEEIDPIKSSSFYPYFDEVLLSYEQGMQKPDPKLFLKCAEKLGVNPDECIFVGDGGSQELYGAQSVDMKPLQAGWYLIKSGQISTRRQDEFDLLEEPLDILEYIK